jgi:oligopeptide transport system permease protein
MTRFLLKRTLYAVITMFFTVTIVFFIIRAIPGTPFASNYNLSPQIKENMLTKYGMDKSLFLQYRTFLSNLLRGDLGISITSSGRSVNDIISDHAVISAFIGFLALIIGCTVSVIIGIYSAIHEGGIIDKIFRAMTALYFATPVFVIAVLLQYIFCVNFDIFPVLSGNKYQNMFLPIIILALFPFSNMFQIVRNGMIDEFKKDYFLFAKLINISKTKLYFKYVLKNISIPVVTLLFPLAVSVLTGSFIIETVFGIPGIGRYYILSVVNRDYTTILGLTVFFTALMIAANLLVDILCKLIDKRIQITN